MRSARSLVHVCRCHGSKINSVLLFIHRPVNNSLESFFIDFFCLPGFVSFVYEIVNVLVWHYSEFWKIFDVRSEQWMLANSQISFVLRIQEIANPLAVYLHVTHFYRVLELLAWVSADLAKQIFAYLWYYSLLTLLLLAHHRIRFSSTRLSVSEYTDVVACLEFHFFLFIFWFFFWLCWIVSKTFFLLAFECVLQHLLSNVFVDHNLWRVIWIACLSGNLETNVLENKIDLHFGVKNFYVLTYIHGVIRIVVIETFDCIFRSGWRLRIDYR